jgi:hypothetical protein
VTRSPDFDELVGTDLAPDEREGLRRVHELLVTAGPPPELGPEIEAGPTLAMTLGLRRRRPRRRVALLAAAIVALGLAFAAGFIAGNGNGPGLGGGHALRLEGTPQAPNALASLRVEPVDASGNWPMQLSVRGLPKGYYVVFLVRGGKLYAPCGAFVVRSEASGVSVSLNAPYDLRRGDTWAVARYARDERPKRTVVLRPVT